MKLPILNLGGEKLKEREMPKQFEEEYRPDLIKKVVLAEQSNKRQKYGAKPKAGMRASARVSRRRRDYRGSYGIGISRVPRKVLSRRGTRMNWVGAVAPGTVGGRRAHPPKAEKNWEKKVNKKERGKAMRSAMAATLVKERVEKRGHKVPEGYPFIIGEEMERMDKTKKVKEVLIKLGFKNELERSAQKKIRAGKGKARGRKYKRKKGLLMVVAGDCGLIKGGRNIPGVDVVRVRKLGVELLAPGTYAGRLTLWSERAIEKLEKERLFM